MLHHWISLQRPRSTPPTPMPAARLLVRVWTGGLGQGGGQRLGGGPRRRTVAGGRDGLGQARSSKGAAGGGKGASWAGDRAVRTRQADGLVAWGLGGWIWAAELKSSGPDATWCRKYFLHHVAGKLFSIMKAIFQTDCEALMEGLYENATFVNIDLLPRTNKLKLTSKKYDYLLLWKIREINILVNMFARWIFGFRSVFLAKLTNSSYG